MATREASGRLAFLDALRGVAALAVMVHHACDLLRPDVGQYFNFGRFGVVLFFLCSGFIIPVSLERHTPRAFWLSRFLRLYPLYWCSLLGALALAAVGRYRLPGEFADAPLATTALNATMLQFFLGVPGAQISYWTLALELLFYASMAVVVALRVGKIVPAIVVGLAGLTGLCGGLLPALSGAATWVPIALLARFIMTMYVGTVVHRVYAGRLAWKAGALVTAVALLGTLAATWASPTDPGVGRLDRAGALLPWLAAYGLFGLALLARHRAIPRWLVGLGTISYSLYLWNILVFAAIPRVGHPLVTAAIWFLATFLLSAATYRWIERPCISLGRALAARTGRDEHPVPTAITGRSRLAVILGRAATGRDATRDARARVSTPTRRY